MTDPDPRDALLARWYDLDLEDDPGDLDLYLAMAERTGGPVLELAAGSGRLAVPLAIAGHDVTAVDLDRAMLDRAERAWAAARPTGRSRRRVGTLRCLEADLLDLDLPDRFGLAFIALNSLLLVGDLSAQRRAIEALARHLRPGGVAVVDVQLPDATDLAAWDGRLVLDWVRPDPEDAGTQVVKTSSARYDATDGSVRLDVLFDRVGPDGTVRRVTRSDRLHLIGAAGLADLALGAGLSVELLAGDHQAMPIGPGAERVVLIAVSV
ncbi:MAG: methyltransferase domain-containing protein [Chloroflexi bacterium]|nr:methyltransferase domain-containing protein [Chloroflexota bacterium]